MTGFLAGHPEPFDFAQDMLVEESSILTLLGV